MNKYKIIFTFLKKYRFGLLCYFIIKYITKIILNVCLLNVFYLKFIGGLYSKESVSTSQMVFAFVVYVFIKNSDLFLSILTSKLEYNTLTDINKHLKKYYISKLLKQDTGFFTHNNAYFLKEKIKLLSDGVVDAISNIFLIIYSILSIFVIHLFLFRAGLSIFCVAFFVTLIYTLLLFYSKRGVINSYNDIQSRRENADSNLIDVLNNVVNIKIFSTKNYEMNKFKSENFEVESCKKAQRIFLIKCEVGEFIVTVVIVVCIFLVLFNMLVSMRIGIGTMLFCINNYISIIISIRILLMEIFKYIETVDGIKSSLEIFNNTPKTLNKKNAKDLMIKGGTIVFKNITFKY